ncbi:CDGSH iron-sulfur domain-containing protein [Actinospica robiniae]|uniref:CDGSH iron-sulfur domain-containing protein n=1 Tax=Actinospica robiniae TaxID=304901 RepID=UPI001FDEC924|nr:CDGSH iron-sulfur domain-containing protein [Actinospica robiniae]
MSGRAEREPEAPGGCGGGRRVRVVMPEEIGPMLVEGPVEIVLANGSVHVSERPTVALCTCRRSRSFPFCDTSHRRRSRPAASSK